VLRVTSISARGSHACAITTAGGIKCWGDNNVGQLGDSTLTTRSAPVSVYGLESGIASISVGGNTTCAVTTSGAAKCWGLNNNGQLGIGSLTNSNVPVTVSGLSSGVTELSNIGSHACAIVYGAAKCWGYNYNGQLGDGTTTSRLTPVNVSGLNSGVTGISSEIEHTCAIVSGAAKCWGSNQFGELGDGTTTKSLTPVSVYGMASGASKIAVGFYHACLLTTAGGVKCWGTNSNGQLGDGTTTDKTTPVSVSGLTAGVSSLSVGSFSSCVITTSGEAQCWGYNGDGRLANGTFVPTTVPVSASRLNPGVSSISVGLENTCAVTTSGAAKCWGLNNYGQLGDGTRVESATPVYVSQ
jgi:alpha-tubulin suppressor-like RCC1 family protein